MSDPNRPPHHGDQPPQDPTTGGGGFGVPPAGPPPQGQPGWGPPHGEPGWQYGQSYGQNYGQPPYGAPGTPTQDEITWGSAAHWSALVAAFVALAFLGPLIVMLTKGTTSPYVRRQAVESLNFQLSILIYGIVSLVLCLVLIGFLLLAVVGVVWLVFTIIGAVRAGQGEEYHYPLTIRLVS